MSVVFVERQEHRKKREAREKGKRKEEKVTTPLPILLHPNSQVNSYAAADLSDVCCGCCGRELAGRGVAPRLPSALRNKGHIERCIYHSAKGMTMPSIVFTTALKG